VKLRDLFRKNEKRSHIPRLQDDTGWQSYLAGRGYAVSATTAIRVAGVIRCADVVAKTIASLGCHLYRATATGSERAKTHDLYSMMRLLPNPRTTAYEFWHMYIFNLMLTSAAYAKIVRDQNEFITEVWNIPTRCVKKHDTGDYIDVSWPQGQVERIWRGYYMYTPGLRYIDGDKPEDFVAIAADVLGLTMALNRYAKDYFDNGTNLGGFVTYPNGIDEESFAKFNEDWKKAYSGVVNQHKWALLEGGFGLTKLESNPEQAQALESRKFALEEVCRMMGVPPHKVFHMERMTYNNVEQMNIEYVQETIDPMAERLEQTMYRDLLTTREQNRHYWKFNTNKLLKGDTAARTAYYTAMRQNGIFSANDILELEDRNTIAEEDGGNIRLVNGNMIPLIYAKDNKPKALQQKGGVPVDGQGIKDNSD